MGDRPSLHLQILEGDKRVVKGLFERISKDYRHTDAMLLNEDEKEERIFNNWTMAYFNVNDSKAGETERMLFTRNFISTADISEEPTHAVRLFWHVAKEVVGPWSLNDR